MITIGIEGTPGSGKSTLSKDLALDPRIVHIEVDKFVKKSGLIKLRNILLGCTNVLSKGVSHRKSRYTRKIKSAEDNIQNKISTPIILRAATNVYFRVVSNIIRKQLKKCEQQGVEIAVVDYALLNVADIWNEFDVRVWVVREDFERKTAVQNRDSVTGGRVDFLSSFARFSIIQYGDGDVIRIDNNGNRGDLVNKGKKYIGDMLKSLGHTFSFEDVRER